MWRGYADLPTIGYSHLMVSHSVSLKDHGTGACTDSAEGLNSGLKRRIGARSRTAEGIDMHLGEYVWHRSNANKLFDAFIDALNDTHYDFE